MSERIFFQIVYTSYINSLFTLTNMVSAAHSCFLDLKFLDPSKQQFTIIDFDGGKTRLTT